MNELAVNCAPVLDANHFSNQFKVFIEKQMAYDSFNIGMRDTAPILCARFIRNVQIEGVRCIHSRAR